MYSFPQFPLISSSAENNSKHTIKYHFLRPINLLKNVWGCVRSLLCVSCLLNNMKNKADHFFTRQTRKDESGDICNCTYIYTYLYMCGPKSWGQRVLRTKKKGPTTMNLSVTLSFCWHTHSHTRMQLDTRLCMCVKNHCRSDEGPSSSLLLLLRHYFA